MANYPTAAARLTRLLGEERATVAKARDIAERGNDALEGNYQACQRDLDRLSHEIADCRLDVDKEARSDEFANALSHPGKGEHNMSNMNQAAEVRYGSPFPQGASFTDLEPKSASIEEAGAYLRAVTNGSESEMRLNEGTPSAGGYLVPTAYVAPLLTLARAATVLDRVGAGFVPLESGTVKMARHDTDPVWAARSEQGAYAAADTTLGLVTWVPQSYGAIVKYSEEFLEDAQISAESYLSEVFAASAAVCFDAACIFGSGVLPQVTGLHNVAGINTVHLAAGGAAMTSYDPMVQAVARLKGKNYSPSGMILAPRLEASLAMLKDLQNRPLEAPQYLAQAPRYASTSVPINETNGAGVNLTEFITGEFGYLLVGVRHELRVRRLSELYLGSGMLGLVFDMRFDVQVARVGAFEIVDAISS
jgi:HK97 family phage major capsid protein